MASQIYIVLNALLIFAFGASAVFWLRLLRLRWGQQSPGMFLESIVPARPRQRPFWTPADALVMLGTMVLSGQLIMAWMIAQGWMRRPSGGDGPDTQSATDSLGMTIATVLSGLIGVAAAALWLRLRDHDARRKLGLTFCMSDLWLGLRASVMILPPVMLVSAAVAHFVPYEHPVLNSLAKHSTATIFVVTFIGTAIITPLVEEFMLRVLFQGGLQGLADRDSGDDGIWTPRAFWPMVMTSLLFALLHIGQGAAPIPLFLLSLGLGYLYRQTGSITPPLVVHMVLNGLTLAVEMCRPPI